MPTDLATTTRPADECPYPKPFRADFDDCPAYHVVHLVVLDSLNKPLRPVWSCRHLQAKAVPGQTGRYYGACQFGDSTARLHWAEATGRERLRALQQLRRDVMPIAQGFIDAGTALKARQGEAAARGDDTEGIRIGMESLGQQYLAELDRLLQRRLPLLEQSQLPKRACMQLANQWVREVTEDTLTTTTRRQQLPVDILPALPDSVRTTSAV